MLKGNITKKIEEEKELRGSMASGASPMHTMTRESMTSLQEQHLAALNLNNSNATNPAASSSASTADSTATRSKQIAIPMENADRSSMVGPINIDRASFQERGSLVLSSSMKRGDGIFSRINNNTNAVTNSASETSISGAIVMTELEK